VVPTVATRRYRAAVLSNAAYVASDIDATASRPIFWRVGVEIDDAIEIAEKIDV
jgi:hypothetical protein